MREGNKNRPVQQESVRGLNFRFKEREVMRLIEDIFYILYLANRRHRSVV